MRRKLDLVFSKNIFFIILFINIIFLLLTLSNSYTDGYNLRQAQTAIVAKNIFYDSLNIFPTRISFFAPQKGNLILEFPFIHFLTALTYKFFSISEINGRFINILFFIFNGILFYKIQKLIFKDHIAKITSSLFVSSPIIFYLGHAFMPETSVMSFYLLAYYFFIKNKIKYNHINQKFMFLSLAIAPLLKPPAAIIFLPIYLDYIKEFNLKEIIIKLIPFILCALPLLLWMYYASLINSSDSSTGINWDWNNVLFEKGSLISHWFDYKFYLKMIRNFSILHLNPLTFVLSIYVLITNFRSKDNLISFHLNWIFGNLIFLFLLAGVNRGHPYYQIFFIPNLLFFTGLGMIKVEEFFRNKNLIIFFSVFINFILSIAIFIYGSHEKLRISNLEEFKKVVADSVIIKKDFPSEYILYSLEGMASTPIFSYYSDSYSNQFSLESEKILDLQKQINLGAKYIFFINTSYGNTIKKLKNNSEIYSWLNLNKNKLYESESIILYQLR